MGKNTYAELMTLSRQSATATAWERKDIAEKFDKTLQRGFGVEASYSGATDYWTGSNSLNNSGYYGMSEKNALTISTFYACIRVISEDCAKLPLKFFRWDKKDDRPFREPFNDSLTYLLSQAPNERITAFDFWCTMISWAVGWGGAFAERQYNRAGELIALYPIHPSRVQITKNAKTGIFTYKVYNDDGSCTNIPESGMFYFFGMSIDGYIGYSVMQLMQNTLSRANSTDRYARHFFDNNGRPTGALVTDETLSPQARNNLKQSWQEQYAGPMNAGKTAVLESGIKYMPFGAPFKDLEFVAQWAHNRGQICEWMRVNPRKVGVETNAKGWATIDAEETDHYQSCLLPWLLRIEQNIRRQLMPIEIYDQEIQCEFDATYILRGDIKTRMEMNNSGLQSGWKTPNEVRQSEGLNPIDLPEMNVTYLQSAMIPLSLAGKIQTQGQETPKGNNPSGK